MGVDAEMFVKLKGREKWLGDDQVRDLSYKLCSTVGHGSFYFSDGSEFGEPHHALSIIRAWNAADAGFYEELNGQVIWTQDGDTIIAAEDEQFIKVHFWTRYYGPGYERGSWLTIKGTAEFLEHHLPGCEVWYGGDSSGICAQLFDASAREEMHLHWLENGHRPYTRYSGAFARPDGPDCPRCAVPMPDCGGGCGQSFFRCDGCGHEEVVFANGARRAVPRGKNLFDVRTPEDGLPVTA